MRMPIDDPQRLKKISKESNDRVLTSPWTISELTLIRVIMDTVINAARFLRDKKRIIIPWEFPYVIY